GSVAGMIVPAPVRTAAVIVGVVVVVVGGAGGCVHVQDVKPLVAYAPPAPEIVVEDARVFTGVLGDDGHAVVLEHTDVVVRDGKIVAVVPTGTTSSDDKRPDGTVVINGADRTL